MVFVRDEGSVYDAPQSVVDAFFSRQFDQDRAAIRERRRRG